MDFYVREYSPMSVPLWVFAYLAQQCEEACARLTACTARADDARILVDHDLLDDLVGLGPHVPVW